MINIKEITKACTDDKNYEVIKSTYNVLESFGEVYISGKCTKKNRIDIHSALADLNKYGYNIYQDTNNDIEDARLIYFNSDSIWRRDKN